jgi:hypothetical protein
VPEPKKRVKVNLSRDQKARLKSLSQAIGLGGKFGPCLKYCLAEWDRRLYSGDRSETEPEKKNSIISIDLTHEEYRRVKSTAWNLGISISSLYRIAFLRTERTKTKAVRHRARPHRGGKTSEPPRSGNQGG